MTVRRRVGGAAIVGGAAAFTYSLVEARTYRLRRYEVPVLANGHSPLRLLHLSDLHLTAKTPDRVAWIRALADLRPDLVVVTGDFLGGADGIAAALHALEPLLDTPGAFVFGSNDYYAATPVRPWRYLMGPSSRKLDAEPLPWPQLWQALLESGWSDLTNASALIGDIVLRGVDDPHIERDEYEKVAGPFPPDVAARIGVTHAPYLRILDAMTTDGADLILAGHTHGGQLCIPGYGALVTNSDLDPKYASGLFRHGAPSGRTLGGPDGRGSFVHVSAGLGTSPYAPVRFACPPEATLLTLTAD